MRRQSPAAAQRRYDPLIRFDVLCKSEISGYAAKVTILLLLGLALMTSNCGCTVYALIGHMHPITIQVVDAHGQPLSDLSVQLRGYRLDTWEEWNPFNAERYRPVRTDEAGRASQIFEEDWCHTYVQPFHIPKSTPRLAGVMLRITDDQERTRLFRFERAFADGVVTDLGAVKFDLTRAPDKAAAGKQ